MVSLSSLQSIVRRVSGALAGLGAVLSSVLALLGGVAHPGAPGVPAPDDRAAAPAQCRAWVEQGVRLAHATGTPRSKAKVEDMIIVAQRESSCRPGVVNGWDSNARRGTPSIGLMQTIQPTFDAHAVPGHTDIRNPVHNTAAAVRYAVARYGSTSNIPGVVALRSGGAYRGY